ncbi:MAG: hypothetical protein BWY82_01034 [Verrucomicrobia bacterium ADurb.Bin474]|nr:MAG: hypothetical protein BWY82_01034 [Verrucomicrobia bacterium ADurb.Bin474]
MSGQPLCSIQATALAADFLCEPWMACLERLNSLLGAVQQLHADFVKSIATMDYPPEEAIQASQALESVFSHIADAADARLPGRMSDLLAAWLFPILSGMEAWLDRGQPNSS